MEIDSSHRDAIRKNIKNLPESVQTIFNFKLPFAIPLPDGVYKICLGGKLVDLNLKRVQIRAEDIIKTVQIRGAESCYLQMEYDSYGKSSFSYVSMSFPYKLDLSEKGRTPLFVLNAHPRDKSKERVIRLLNRFIDVMRYTTKEYWVPYVRYQDLLQYRASYWDGKKEYNIEYGLFDTGMGGIKISKTHPFQIEKQTLDTIKSFLSQETPLDSSTMLFLNAKNACLQENFGLAIIEAVTGLEVVLYKFITVQGRTVELSNEDLNEFISKVGLTGNIKTVLKMLTKGLEQIDDACLRECTGAIRIRNKILHKGLLDVGSTDTEKRLLAIEKMISYLQRITP